MLPVVYTLEFAVTLFTNKGGKFLKKLCCYVGGRVYQGNLVFINYVDNVNWPR